MENSNYIALSLATVMQRSIDVAANNMANANTAGFKGERILFDSYLSPGDAGEENGATFVLDRGSFMDDSQGPVRNTGNVLDVALQGPGWFSYQTQDGQQAFGRDGRFAVDAQGNLVTQAGARVLDAGGQPIALPPDAVAELVIADDGTLSSPATGALGRLGVFDVPDLKSYTRIGAGMFVAPAEADVAAPLPDLATKVVQGALEGSNVQPIVEMTRMMAIQKSYEQATKLMGTGDELRKDALRRLGQV
ncbi:flagellar basal-body rod protein FlgF [Oceanicola granulosus HTCC2516]|uniref:Flagellar basal-body rod protein FlgF n=1 Tax=Oceanicola granulosus (strain ATCC BAA-861 / DSM 15982 / KCTC 12143 / HTCC2516) TaxID=314256 RepID=Q2CGG3_OCEGH|nr:flagellar hook-basal body complex protein [Oceanicola granulosus]EAR51755.1 flagellar basal-body rod protein FlgF [Oceanicola granulosus HTCC2516]